MPTETSRMRPKLSGVMTRIVPVRCQRLRLRQVCYFLIEIFFLKPQLLSGRGHRTRDTARMAEIMEAEISDNDRGGAKQRMSRKRRRKPKKTKNDEDSDPDDEDFSELSIGHEESSGESEIEDDSDVVFITNKEVYFCLLFNDIPTLSD